jgi:hypothetical protein
MMPFGMGGGTGGGSGSGRRASKRRRHSSADEKQTAVGEEFAGSEGINEMLLPSAEAEQERLAGAVAELRGGSSGGQALPRAGIVPTRARRKQQTRSRAQYLLEDKETWSGPTANPPVIR